MWECFYKQWIIKSWAWAIVRCWGSCGINPATGLAESGRLILSRFPLFFSSRFPFFRSHTPPPLVTSLYNLLTRRRVDDLRGLLIMGTARRVYGVDLPVERKHCQEQHDGCRITE